MASYGSFPPSVVERREKSGQLPLIVKMSSVMAVMAISLLVLVAMQLAQQGSTQTHLLQAAKGGDLGKARMSVLCEGHFLDTATGIPEEAYSTLSHPAQLEGYKEPLPEDIRAEIDAKYYDGLVYSHPYPLLLVLPANAMGHEWQAMSSDRLCVQGPEYQFAGCLDDDKVGEVQTAVGEAKSEHVRLAHYASGHDETFWHPHVFKK